MLRRTFGALAPWFHDPAPTSARTLPAIFASNRLLAQSIGSDFGRVRCALPSPHVVDMERRCAVLRASTPRGIARPLPASLAEIVEHQSEQRRLLLTSRAGQFQISRPHRFEADLSPRLEQRRSRFTARRYGMARQSQAAAASAELARASTHHLLRGALDRAYGK